MVPDADLKIYLVASDTVRAGRRSAEDTTAGRATDPATTGADLARRDRLDSSRTASPLRAAEDAVEVDTSVLDIEGVLASPRRPGRGARHADRGAVQTGSGASNGG